MTRGLLVTQPPVRVLQRGEARARVGAQEDAPARRAFMMAKLRLLYYTIVQFIYIYIYT